jgi:hypothetical protein
VNHLDSSMNDLKFADHRYGLGLWVKENHFGYRVVFVHGGYSLASASLVLGLMWSPANCHTQPGAPRPIPWQNGKLVDFQS